MVDSSIWRAKACRKECVTTDNCSEWMRADVIDDGVLIETFSTFNRLLDILGTMCFLCKHLRRFFIIDRPMSAWIEPMSLRMHNVWVDLPDPSDIRSQEPEPV